MEAMDTTPAEATEPEVKPEAVSQDTEAPSTEAVSKAEEPAPAPEEKPEAPAAPQPTHQRAGYKRVANRDDDDERKRICGPGPDVTTHLEELMVHVGDNKDANIVEVLKSLRDLLSQNVEKEEAFIVGQFARCIKFKPEKLTIYSTLAGLVNADAPEFGKNFVQRVVDELNHSLKEGEFDIAVRIITFIADLANTGILSLESVAGFLNQFTAFVEKENLQTDFFVYCVLHTLPWVGPAFHSAKSPLLEPILSKVGAYIASRKKHHLKALQVWIDGDKTVQEDYIDCLWGQIRNLQRDNWNEQHIVRVDMAYKVVLSGAQKHALPEVVIPAFDDKTEYPLPRVVFRLFSAEDVVGGENPLPDANSIERFLVEEDLNWIIANNYLNWRVCARELLAYHRADSIPLYHCITEVVFSQLFRLPEAPYMELFYGALLIELCHTALEKMPQVLAHASQILYQRTSNMQIICVERFVSWFSYHLSNFQFRWCWEDWEDCLKEDELSPKLIFVREVLEKSMRLSYHKKIVEILPKEFKPIIPNEPKFQFVVDDEEHPAHEDSLHFAAKIRNRVTCEEILLSVKRNEDDIKEGECPYDPDQVAIFTGTLLKMASQTFSHTFAAINKYLDVFLKFVNYADALQPVLLRTIHECWGEHRQFVIMLVDKLLKVQVFDPHIIIAWVFSGDLKEELGRSWIWEVLNLAIKRASIQHSHSQANKTSVEIVYAKKKARLESQAKNTTSEQRENDDEDEDMGADAVDPTVEDRLAKLAGDVSQAQIDYDKSKDALRNVILDVSHKFALAITEHLCSADEEGADYDTPFYRFLVGRFKEMLILNWRDVFLFWADVDRELLSSTAIDERIRQIFVQFRALKY
uniref:Nuclear cap-binding protein subunit 1 n=1 Tax=Panagrellus redivivus TaxID=6233 RepID=A0A7E4VBE2_PANRE